MPSLEVEIGGRRYVPDSWGLDGCQIPAYDGAAEAGERLHVTLYLRQELVRQGLGVQAEVVRLSAASQELVLRFVDFLAEDIANLGALLEQSLAAIAAAEEDAAAAAAEG